MQRRGRELWRIDSAAFPWARIMMLPSRSLPTGAQSPARVLAVPALSNAELLKRRAKHPIRRSHKSSD